MPATALSVFRSALLSVAFAPACALAAIFGIDDRVTAPGNELAAIGILTGGANVVYGSGFLIDPCTVLSARHVGGEVEQLVGTELTFHAGKLAATGRVIAAGPFQPGPPFLRAIGKDWMIVRLRRCLGRKLGFLRLSTAAAVFAGRNKFEVEDAGFPRDRPLGAGLTVDPDCRLLWVGGGRIAHDCATLPGNSGGPLLARDSIGWVVIGINAAGADRAAPEPFRASEVNLAVDIGTIISEVCSVISSETRNNLCHDAKLVKR